MPAAILLLKVHSTVSHKFWFQFWQFILRERILSGGEQALADTKRDEAEKYWWQGMGGL